MSANSDSAIPAWSFREQTQVESQKSLNVTFRLQIHCKYFNFFIIFLYLFLNTKYHSVAPSLCPH